MDEILLVISNKHFQNCRDTKSWTRPNIYQEQMWTFYCNGKKLTVLESQHFDKANDKQNIKNGQVQKNEK